MTNTLGKNIESLVREKVLVFESASTLDELCDRIGKGFEQGYAVSIIASLWYNIYTGAKSYASYDIDMYAYKLANETSQRQLKSMYELMDPYLRGGKKNGTEKETTQGAT